jgi:hypothetical protein
MYRKRRLVVVFIESNFFSLLDFYVICTFDISVLAIVAEFFSQYPDIVTHPEVRKLTTFENCLLYLGLKDQRI